jgi:hypothetical protein
MPYTDASGRDPIAPHDLSMALSSGGAIFFAPQRLRNGRENDMQKKCRKGIYRSIKFVLTLFNGRQPPVRHALHDR